MRYAEIKQDLFKVDHSYTLAHCISQDCKMGAGIAKEFHRRFPKMQSRLLQQTPQIGDALSHYDQGQMVFNLITKAKYWQKPTYDSFKSTILSLKQGMENLNLDKLAIPLLGAGLDKLSWAKNREIIQEVFADTDVEILVCRVE